MALSNIVSHKLRVEQKQVLNTRKCLFFFRGWRRRQCRNPSIIWPIGGLQFLGLAKDILLCLNDDN